MTRIVLFLTALFFALPASAQTPGVQPEICVTSASQTADYNLVCLSATATGGRLGITNFGTATGNITVDGSATLTNGVTPTSGFTDGDFIVSSGGKVSDSGVLATLLTQMPQFTTLCNATGVTAAVQQCSAVTAVLPLSITSGASPQISFAGTYTSNNTAFGFNAFNATATGVNNVGFGFTTLTNTTSGSQNAALGGNALFHDTSGSNNMAIGYNSLTANTTGGANVAIGTSANPVSTAGNNNVSVGFQSHLVLSSGTTNTAIGFNSGNTITTGINNIIVGGTAGSGSHSLTTGSSNSVLCTYPNAASLGITTGSNNLVLGCPTGLAAASANKIVIADPAGNIRYDWGNTTAAVATLAGPVASTTTIQTKTIYSAAGTPVPTCNGAAEGTWAAVSDATGPTYASTYASGGTVHVPVYCNGTNWITP